MKDIIFQIYFNMMFIFAFVILQEPQSGVLIYPDNLTVFEGSNATVKCSYQGQSGLQGVIFTLGETTVAAMLLPNCTLNVIGLGNYRTDCEGNKTFSLTLVNISRYHHHKSLKCRVLQKYGSQQSTNEADVYVNVPVETLVIKPDAKSIEKSENSSINLNCTSSYSRPIPVITWIVSDQINEIMQFTGVQTYVTNTNGFTSVIDTFNLRPNRTVNGWIIYCVVQVSHIQHQEIQSNFVTLNITYPPESRLMINGHVEGGEYDVTENDTGMLNCTITGGNPKPILTWKKCFDNETYIRKSNFPAADIQTSMLTWRAKSFTDRKCTCMSVQKERNESVSINVNIRYPATIREFFVNGYNFQSIVTADEEENITFICNVESNPVSNTSIRLSTGRTLTSSVSNSLYYTLDDLNCLDTGAYLCYSRNKHNLEKISTQQLYLFVRCSPRANPNISYKTNITSTAEESLVLRFPFLAYPPPDSLTWQKLLSSNWVNISSSAKFRISKVDHSVSLTIHNVMEKDFGRYRLIITNSVGSYKQNFNVIREVSMAGSDKTSITGLAVGSSTGAVFFLIGLFIVIWLFRSRRLKQKHPHTAENTYENTLETGAENDQGSQYEKLDSIGNISVQYSALTTSDDTQNTNESITNAMSSTDSKNMETCNENSAYVNMKI